MMLLPDVRIQDVVTNTQMLVNVYNNTIFDVLGQVCAADDIECQRAKRSINAFGQGRLPTPEVEGTDEVSSMATQGAQGAAMMLGELISSPEVANVTDMFFNPAVKSVLVSDVEDTAKTMPPGSMDTTLLDQYNQANSTADIAAEAQQGASLGSLIGLIDTFVAEDEDSQGWWGAFKSGLANSGNERKGQRDGGN
jgi:hypothetical protein